MGRGSDLPRAPTSSHDLPRSPTISHARQVGFREALYVSAVELYETYHAGAVTSIALWAGEQHGWDVVWKGEAQQQQLPSEARLFSPPIAARPYATRFLRVEMSVAPHPNGTHLAAQVG